MNYPQEIKSVIDMRLYLWKSISLLNYSVTYIYQRLQHKDILHFEAQFTSFVVWYLS